MKPITLHRLFKTWESKTLRLGHYRPTTNNKHHRDLLRSAITLQFLVTPLLALAITAVLSSLGVHIQWPAAALGLVMGVVFGVVIGMAFGFSHSLAVGAANGAAFASALGLAGGVVFGVLGTGIACSIILGVIGGLVFGAAFGVAEGIEVALAEGVKMSALFGVVLGLLVGAAHPATNTTDDAIAGLIAGFIATTSLMAGFLRTPLWLIELLVFSLITLLRRVFPERATALFAAWIPLFHGELIYLPLPGLRPLLLDLADNEPELVSRTIIASSTSPGLRRTTVAVTAELRARSIEQAIRDRLFERLAAFQLEWLPSPESIPSNSPLVVVHSAARDLAAGGTNQHHRRLALERARRTLNSFQFSIPTRENRYLHTRLLSVTQELLRVIDEEFRRLARDAQKNPQVPVIFVAGTALDPALPDATTLFKGRRDVSHEIEHDLAPDRRGVIVLVGQRRIGKSSLANWLPKLLGTAHVVTVDFQQLSGSPLRAMPHRLVLDAVAATPALALPSPPPASDAWRDALDWLRALDATLGDRPMLIVVDEVERLQNGIKAGWCSTDFLDFLRAAGDALSRIRFLVMTAYPLARLGPHWIDRLISVTPRAITYLDEADARELLVRPIADFPDIYPPGGVDRILRETGCHPFLVQKVGYELCQRINLHRTPGTPLRATDDDLTRVFEAVLDAEIPFAELWRQRTPDERAALSRIAAEGPATARTPLLRLLEREGYLREREGALDIAVPLFEEWIATRALTSPEASGDAAG